MNLMMTKTSKRNLKSNQNSLRRVILDGTLQKIQNKTIGVFLIQRLHNNNFNKNRNLQNKLKFIVGTQTIRKILRIITGTGKWKLKVINLKIVLIKLSLLEVSAILW